MLLTLLVLAAAPSDDALLKASIDEFSIEGLDRAHLAELRGKIDAAQPRVTGPLLQLGSGATMALAGFLGVVLAANGVQARATPWTTDSHAPNAVAWATFITGSVFMAFGALFAACGAVRLTRYLPVRRNAAFKLDVIDTELEMPSPPMAAPR
jgi:hypothetical protein